MALEDNVRAWHCGVCGVPHKWGLCRSCLAEYAPDGVLPPWLVFLRSEVNREKKRAIRQARLADAGVLFGDQICRVQWLSLEALAGRGVAFAGGDRPARKCSVRRYDGE